ATFEQVGSAVSVPFSWGFAYSKWKANPKQTSTRDEQAAALEKAEKNLYVYKIAKAERCLSSGQPYRAQEILDDCRADLRGWEWHFLKRWWQRRVITLCGHQDLVRSVVFSADGRMLISSSDDKTVKVWNASTGEELLTLERHSNAVGSLAL